MPFIKDNSAEPLNPQELKASKAATKAGGFFQRLGEDLRKRKQNIGNDFGMVSRGEITPLEYKVRGAGQIAGGVGDVIGRTVGAVAKAGFKNLLTTDAQNIAKSGASYVANSPVGRAAIQGAGKVAQGWNQFEEAAPRTAAVVGAVGNIASVLPQAKGVQLTGREALRTGKDAAGVLSSVRAVGLPEKAAKAVGQIVQGKKKDVSTAMQVLSRVDTKNVKSYGDLTNAVRSNTTALSQAMDEVLLKDQTKRNLSQLSKVQDVGGTKVSTNYVSQALAHLRELYESSNDPVAAQRIANLTQKANTEGLTVKELNDIAKQYGSEYGEKAFTKLGEPRTSVNAVAYENTRSGVKETLRELLPDDTARKLDKQISENIRVETLAKNMEERVNKLMQTVNERGLIEKAGSVVGKAVDLATLNSVSGFLGGVLKQSNVGLKTMNALDLESALKKNLKIIQEAEKAVKEGDFIPKSLIGKGLKKMKGKGGLNLQDISRSGVNFSEKEWQKLNNSAFIEALKDYGKKTKEMLEKAKTSPRINLDTINRLESQMDDVKAAQKMRGSLTPEAAKLWDDRFKKIGVDFNEYYSLPQGLKMKEKVR